MISAQKLVKVVPAVTRASATFGKYKKESDKAVRRVDIKEDESLKAIKLAWLRLCEDFVGDVETPYARAVELVHNLEYSARDVESFSLMLSELQTAHSSSHYDGLFLSALINMSKDDTYIVHTVSLNRPLNFLGYENVKNIIVKGDVGIGLGNGMKQGTIKITGNADSCLGERMTGGRITVNGETGDAVGGLYGNRGGEIYLNGNFGQPTYAHISSDIYHNGKLIHSVNSWPMLSCQDYWHHKFWMK